MDFGFIQNLLTWRFAQYAGVRILGWCGGRDVALGEAASQYQ